MPFFPKLLINIPYIRVIGSGYSVLANEEQTVTLSDKNKVVKTVYSYLDMYILSSFIMSSRAFKLNREMSDR